jgi:acrylyl-CoA reductase (NADPH)
MAPMEARREAWARLARDLAPNVIDSLTSEVSLGAAIETAGDLLAGRVRGRVVVNVRA